MIQNNSCPYCGANKVAVLEQRSNYIPGTVGTTIRWTIEAHEALFQLSQVPEAEVVGVHCGGCGLVFHRDSIL